MALKRFTRVTLTAAGIAVAAGLLARRRSRKASRQPRPFRNAAELGLDREARHLTRSAIQYFVVPVWTAAGVADWLCHRATKIEKTTGLKETLIHLLMLFEAGIPVTAGLLLEIDPQVLAAMIAAFFVHEATAMWDVTYAVARREVRPIEQHVDSFLEMIPLTAVVLVSLLHWPQLKALLGLRVEPPSRIRLKQEPLPVAYVCGTLATMLLLEVLPYAEELARDWAQYPGRLVPPPEARPTAVSRPTAASQFRVLAAPSDRRTR
jgi:hypothetical protein